MLSFLAMLLTFLLISSPVAPLAKTAEEVDNVEETETRTKFESVMVKKGSLITKEIIDCCSFNLLQFQTASLTDIETGIKVYALRITCSYYNSKYDNGEAVGVMDPDEIDVAISTLEYIQQHINEAKDYTEIKYISNGGVEIGAYKSDTDKKLFVKVNSDATQFYGIDKINSLIDVFKKVKATFP